MTLPNAGQAVLEIKKLVNYSLNSQHTKGKDKARVFSSFGITIRDAEILRQAILFEVNRVDAIKSSETLYGSRYWVDFAWNYNGRTIPIRTSWIVSDHQPYPGSQVVLYD